VLDLGSSGASVRLAPVDLGADVLARFESTMAPTPKPMPAVEEAVSPPAPELPPDSTAMPPTLTEEEPASEANPVVSPREPARVGEEPFWPLLGSPLEITLGEVHQWPDGGIVDGVVLWEIGLMELGFHQIEGMTITSTASGADFGSIATTASFQFSSWRGTAVPEPGPVILLLSVGVIGWIGRRRETW